MEKDVLVRCTEVKREVDWLERRISTLREDIVRIERGGTVRDMVKGGSGNDQIYHIEGMPVGDIAKKKELLGKRISQLSAKQIELEEAMLRAEEYILAVPDIRARQALQRIYLDGMTQRETARRMNLDQSRISRAIQPYVQEKTEETE